MKSILLLVLFAFIAACTPAEAPKKVKVSAPATSEFKQPDVASVEMGDKSCVTDADCDAVSLKCSCSCGEGISKNKLQKYLDLVESSCKNYQGPTCKIICNGTVKCLERVCTYVR